MIRRSFTGRLGLILGLACLLLWAPLLNGYPFLHADSGTYIWSSVLFLVPQDRPIGYSLFLRATQLVPSLWAVAIVQALGTAYLLWRVGDRLLARHIAHDTTRAWLGFAVAGVTVVLTTVSVYVGWVIADILASWLFLGTVLWFIAATRFDRLLAGLAIVTGMVSHNSHVLLALGLAVPLGIYMLLTRGSSGKTFRRAALLWAVVLAVALAGMFAVNLYLRAGAEVTRGGDTILLDRFAESGVLQDTLAANCDSQSWDLCASADTIRAHAGEPRWFLFGQDSPIRQVGWEKGTAEQRAIVWSAFRCCAVKIFESSAQETWRQFWLIDIQSYLVPLADRMNAVLAIEKNFPREWDAFHSARQQSNLAPPARLLPVEDVTVQSICLFAALALIAYGLTKRARREVLFLGGVLYLLVLNALVMAAFSGAVPRYQGRVYWLLVYGVLVALVAMVGARRIHQKTVRAVPPQ